jgi:two-component system, NtrC family, nitrogen regulation sensor histidine kinase NtrY
MNSNRYYTGIIVRVILITLSALLLAFTFFKTNYLYSILVLLILEIVQTWSLIRYILRRRNDLKRMLEYIKENNPTLYFSQARNYPFNELGDFLNEVGEIVRQVRIEKESQLQYMNYIVKHVGTGLLSFDQDENIEVINQAAKDLLGIIEINSISSLENVHRGLPDTLRKIKADEQKVITLKSGNRLQQLAIRMSVFKIGHKEIRLASFQDIKNEMDEKEMESWQKLIRVLTHEIINSVTPVTSLTSTISGFFRKDDKVLPAKALSDDNIKEALTGLGYIEERGKSLIDFVSKFRSLTKLPAPKFEEISVDRLFDGITRLKKDELAADGIKLKCISTGEKLSIYCDRSLIEHVLLNLLNNSADAIKSRKSGMEGIIEISGSAGENQHPRIEVKDNGSGISDPVMENIFIPFFTTKEHGSGIGLSLSRQIMKLHGGTITAFSKPGIETVISLIF